MIRKITQDDVPALLKVRVATRENAMSLEQLADIGVTEESVSSGIEGTYCGWLWEEDGKIVGFAMGDYEQCELSVIALLPEYEKKGIGRKLLTQVENWLQSQGCNEIWLTTDIDTSLRAYGFYIKHGWRDSKTENGNRYMVKSFGH